ADLLRSFKKLERINNKPAAEFWKDSDARQQAFDAYVKEVKALPVEQQVPAVVARLKEHNPGFDGKATHRIDPYRVVADLGFCSDKVTMKLDPRPRVV